ncbi:MAG: hypothetical protein AAF366_07090 [Pseudomonadota bacterium]
MPGCSREASPHKLTPTQKTWIKAVAMLKASARLIITKLDARRLFTKKTGLSVVIVRLVIKT